MAVAKVDTLAAVPSGEESEFARRLGRRLAAVSGRGEREQDSVVRLQVEGAETEEVTLPNFVVRLLARVLAEVGEGKAVSVVPTEAEISTQKAAEILNVSRPYLVRLLDEGKIPSRKVGVHRRVLLRDLLLYKRRDDEKRHAILDELTAQAQELDMGY